VEIREICRGNFINHAMHSLEILSLPRIDEKFIKKCIRVHNLEHVERAAKEGKGIIFILGHIGFYYLSGVTVQLLTGIPLNDISQEVSKLDISPLDRKILERRLANYQDRIGGKVFERGGSLLGVVKAIKRNEAISLFLDAFTTETDPIVNLLDRKTRMPQGPVRMAMQTGAAIIFSTAVREPDGSMTFTFYDPVELEVTGDKKKDLQHNAQKCADLLDPVIRQKPDQWHLWRLFHERFSDNHDREPHRIEGSHARYTQT
jgi:KDO2-lipid IV(A) lauroyltransferase